MVKKTKIKWYSIVIPYLCATLYRVGWLLWVLLASLGFLNLILRTERSVCWVGHSCREELKVSFETLQSVDEHLGISTRCLTCLNWYWKSNDPWCLCKDNQAVVTELSTGGQQGGTTSSSARRRLWDMLLIFRFVLFTSWPLKGSFNKNCELG